MTEQRALEIVKDLIPYMSEVDEEAMNIVERAVEKQIAKKPTEQYGEDEHQCVCPICGHWLYADEPYCDRCGQKLDWSEV